MLPMARKVFELFEGPKAVLGKWHVYSFFILLFPWHLLLATIRVSAQG